MKRKSCESCGAENDLLMSHCAYCGSMLEGVDVEEASEDLEELVIKTSQWIGKYEAMVSDYTSLNNAKQVDTMAGQPIFGSLFEQTFGSNAISYSKTLGEATKYLDMLEIKASGRSSLTSKVRELKQRFEEARQQEKRTKKKGIKIILLLILALIGFIFFCLMMASITK